MSALRDDNVADLLALGESRRRFRELFFPWSRPGEKHTFLRGGPFELFMMFAYLVNIVVLTINDTYDTESTSTYSVVLKVFDLAFCVLNTVEIAIRCFAFGTHKLRHPLRALDALLVLVNFVLIVVFFAGYPQANLSLMSIRAGLRFLRPFFITTDFPALRIFVVSVTQALLQLRDAVLLLVLFLLWFGVAGVFQFGGQLRPGCVNDLFFASQELTQYPTLLPSLVPPYSTSMILSLPQRNSSFSASGTPPILCVNVNEIPSYLLPNISFVPNSSHAVCGNGSTHVAPIYADEFFDLLNITHWRGAVSNLIRTLIQRNSLNVESFVCGSALFTVGPGSSVLTDDTPSFLELDDPFILTLTKLVWDIQAEEEKLRMGKELSATPTRSVTKSVSHSRTLPTRPSPVPPDVLSGSSSSVFDDGIFRFPLNDTIPTPWPRFSDLNLTNQMLIRHVFQSYGVGPKISCSSDQICDVDVKLDDALRGYSCPYGFHCSRLAPNPYGSWVSFDNLGYAILTVYTCISFQLWYEAMFWLIDSTDIMAYLYFGLTILIGAFMILNLTSVVLTVEFDRAKANEKDKLRLEQQTENQEGAGNGAVTSGDEQEENDGSTELIAVTPTTGGTEMPTLITASGEGKVTSGTFPAPPLNSAAHEKKSVTMAEQVAKAIKSQEAMKRSSEMSAMAIAQKEKALMEKRRMRRAKRAISLAGGANPNQSQLGVPSVGGGGQESSRSPSPQPEKDDSGSDLDESRSVMGAMDGSDAPPAANAQRGPGEGEPKPRSPTARNNESTAAPPAQAQVTQKSAKKTQKVTAWSKKLRRLNDKYGKEAAAARFEYQWISIRQWIQQHIVHANWFFYFNALIILASSAFILANHYGMDPNLRRSLDLVGLAFVSYFTLEWVLRLIADDFKTFVRHRLNVVDFLILVWCWVDFAVDTVDVPVIRLFRSLRLLTLLREFPALYEWIRFIVGALKVSPVLILMMLVAMIIFACLGMQLLGGRMCGTDSTQVSPPTWTIVYKTMIDDVPYMGPLVRNNLTGRLLINSSAAAPIATICATFANNYTTNSSAPTSMSSFDNGISNCTYPPIPWIHVEQIAPPPRRMCEGLPRSNFDNFGNALLTAFQILTADDWNYIMYNAMTITGAGMSILFVLFLYVGNYVLVNLFVAVLLSANAELRQTPEEIEKEEKQRKLREAQAALAKLEEEEEEREKAKELLQAKNNVDDDDDEAMSEVSSVSSGTNSVDAQFVVLRNGRLRQKTWSTKLLERCLWLYDKSEGWARKLSQSLFLQVIMACVIVVGSVSDGLENPLSAPDSNVARTLEEIDLVITVIYCVEVAINVHGFGLLRKRTSYMRRDPWNVFDFILVVVSIVGVLVSDLRGSTFVRTVKVLRAFRPLRLIKRSPGMRLVLSALGGSASAMSNVLLVTLMLFLLYGAVGVQLFGGKMRSCYFQGTQLPGLDKENCLRVQGEWLNDGLNFDNIFSALLVLYQAATLEGWTGTMYKASDTVGVDKAMSLNANPVAASIYFVLIAAFAGFFVVNIFIAVLIDSYNKEKRQASLQRSLLTTREQEAWILTNRRIAHQLPLLVTRGGSSPVRQMSASPTLNNSTAEFNGSFPSSPSRRDGSGEDEILLASASPTGEGPSAASKLLLFRSKVRRVVRHRAFNVATHLVTIITVVAMGIEHYPQDDTTTKVIAYLNEAAAILFAVEALIKIFGESWRGYINSNWNKIDAFVATVSIVMLVGDETGAYNPRSFALFRALRVLRLAQITKGILTVDQLVAKFGNAAFSLGHVLAVMFIFFFIFAVIGQKLFGRVRWEVYGSGATGIDSRSNFASLSAALFLLVRIMTGGNWPDLLWSAGIQPPFCDPQIGECGPDTPIPELYVVLYLFISMFVLKHLLTAVLLDSFESSGSRRAISKKDAATFYANWQRFDPQCTLNLNPHQVLPFVRRLPLGCVLGFTGRPPSKRIVLELQFLTSLKLASTTQLVPFEVVVDCLCTMAYFVPMPEGGEFRLQLHRGDTSLVEAISAPLRQNLRGLTEGVGKLKASQLKRLSQVPTLFTRFSEFAAPLLETRQYALEVAGAEVQSNAGESAGPSPAPAASGTPSSARDGKKGGQKASTPTTKNPSSNYPTPPPAATPRSSSKSTSKTTNMNSTVATVATAHPGLPIPVLVVSHADDGDQEEGDLPLEPQSRERLSSLGPVTSTSSGTSTPSALHLTIPPKRSPPPPLTQERTSPLSLEGGGPLVDNTASHKSQEEELWVHMKIGAILLVNERLCRLVRARRARLRNRALGGNEPVVGERPLPPARVLQMIPCFLFPAFAIRELERALLPSVASSRASNPADVSALQSTMSTLRRFLDAAQRHVLVQTTPRVGPAPPTINGSASSPAIPFPVETCWMQGYWKWAVEARRLVVKDVVAIQRTVSSCCPVFRFDIEKFLGELLQPPGPTTTASIGSVGGGANLSYVDVGEAGESRVDSTKRLIVCPWSLREELLWTLGWIEAVMDLLCTSFSSIVDQPGLVHQKVPLSGPPPLRLLLGTENGFTGTDQAHDLENSVSLFQLLTLRVQGEVRRRRLQSLRAYLQRMCLKPELHSPSGVPPLSVLPGTGISLDLEEDSMLGTIFRLMKKLSQPQGPVASGVILPQSPQSDASELTGLFGHKTLRTLTAEIKALKRRLLQPAIPPAPPRPTHQTHSSPQRLSLAYKPSPATRSAMASPITNIQFLLERSQVFAEERQRMYEQYLEQRNDILQGQAEMTDAIPTATPRTGAQVREKMLHHFLCSPSVIGLELEILEAQFVDLGLLQQLGEAHSATTTMIGSHLLDGSTENGAMRQSESEPLYWTKVVTQLTRGEDLRDRREEFFQPHVAPQEQYPIRMAASPSRVTSTLATAVEEML